MKYTAVIRTLGTAGEKYQRELDSLRAQTMPPEEIIVYIAEGYPIPKETCGLERYVYVKKGMVAQRALPFDEVKTEWVLFLDDDLYMPPTAVETLFEAVKAHAADVVSPDVFRNGDRPLMSELLMTLSGRMRARRGDNEWGYKVMATGGYSYNKTPGNGALMSQTNAGSCFLCRKQDYLSIKFEEELWLDAMPYPIGEDQTMFYKMYLSGLKVMTHYCSGIEHLDAGNNLGNKDREKRLIEADYFFRRVFFQRFLYEPEGSALKRLWKKACINYFYGFGFAVSLLKGESEILQIKRRGHRRAVNFINSPEYKALPPIKKNI